MALSLYSFFVHMHIKFTYLLFHFLNLWNFPSDWNEHNITTHQCTNYLNPRHFWLYLVSFLLSLSCYIIFVSVSQGFCRCSTLQTPVYCLCCCWKKRFNLHSKTSKKKQKKPHQMCCCIHVNHFMSIICSCLSPYSVSILEITNVTNSIYES